MDWVLVLIQLLNGAQFGVLLFLVTAGLTLVFGIMNLINLGHGVQYMVGAYLGVVFISSLGNFWLALPFVVIGSLLLAIVLELSILRRLYTADHLRQVLATFGVLLLVTELVDLGFGPDLRDIAVPALLSGSVAITDTLQYPIYRIAIIILGAVVAIGLWIVISHTRIGALIRAGSTDPAMVSALGVNIDRLFLAVFAFGGMLAGLAGFFAAPILVVEPHMGDQILIVCFVVIVIGGIGSIQGALAGALLVGILDTLGRAFLTDLVRLVTDASSAATIGPALASMLIYLAMVAVLVWRPRGLFPAKG